MFFYCFQHLLTLSLDTYVLTSMPGTATGARMGQYTSQRLGPQGLDILGRSIYFVHPHSTPNWKVPEIRGCGGSSSLDAPLRHRVSTAAGTRMPSLKALCAALLCADLLESHFH